MVRRVGVLCVALFAAFPAAAEKTPKGAAPRAAKPAAELHPRDYPSVVLDLSSHNTIPIDGSLKSRLGIGLAIHRATLGRDTGSPNDIDPQFPDRAKQIVRAGLRLGAYHWGTPTDGGVRQADDFLRVVKSVCDQLSPAQRRVLLALDWEPHGNDPDHYMRAADVDRFLSRVVARTGRSAVVYAYENFIHEQRAEIAAVPGLWGRIGRHPLWIANYKVNTDRDGNPLRGGMILPRLAGSPWSGWSLWQYTSGDNGPVADFPPGKIGGESVDRSVFRGGRGDFERFVNAHSWDCIYRRH
ncbi:MAG: glycoside hydrolase family 25 protein [Alphaproteobacteria bacterium]|nr:glycoside hydrolase family 25 protein [Alphaproteobacteria bacterium]